MKQKIAILGGGLAGLAAADKLTDKFQVIVFEKQEYLGGLASSFLVGDTAIPKYYHHVVQHNTITKEYLQRFGLLETCKNWQKIKVAIGINDKLYTINKVSGLLKFKHLSLLGKIRFGLFGLYTLSLMNTENIPDDENAEQWLVKLAGREVTKKIFEPLYARNKFNIPLSEISAKQFANRLKEKEISYNFSYPQAGLQAMIDGLEKAIISKKGVIFKNCALKTIDVKNKEIFFDDKKIKIDYIINTMPIPEFLKIAKGLPEDYAKKLSKLRYCPCVGVTFGTKDFLKKGLYWINLFGERIHMLMQHSVLCDMYPFKVNWCLRYGGSEEDLNLSDEEIKKEYLAVIKKYFPQAEIVWAKVFREKYAEPVYDKEYIAYAPEYETPVSGLYHAGIQVTFPKIRNMNVALESGERVADIIFGDKEHH